MSSRATLPDEPSGRPDAPILLVTKLHPPFVPAQTVVRERLFERLRSGKGLRLSLVACPAGFGKSTVLAAWRERESRDRPVAWVSLDEADNDPVVLWSHVIHALGRVCPGLADARLTEMVASAPLLEVVLPRLVNELVEQPEIALVLDDFHRLSSTAARESAAWFVDRAPSTVQLVLATRTDPALPLGALRAHGQLLELRADELRFTGAEAVEFLNGHLGLDMDEADVELLVARTEGWPAGIYLAALSLSGKPDKHGLVTAFDGTSAHVVDFLSSEVLAGYEPDLQNFMLRTSVLERLCAPLCDAVLEQSLVRRGPGVVGALESLPAGAGRPAAMVSLSSSLRADPPCRAGRRGGAQRARAHGPAPPGHRALRAPDRSGALPLLQHRAQPREVALPQARRLLPG